MKRTISIPIAVTALLVLAICELSINFPIIPRALAAGQPPIDHNTFWAGTYAWGPGDADPAMATDQMSKELIFNCYQGLIGYNGEKYWEYVPVLATNVPNRQDITMTVTSVSQVGPDPTGSTWTDGSTSYICKGWVDEGKDGFNAGDALYLSGASHWRTWTIDAKSGTSTITLSLWRGSYVFNIRTSPAIYFFDSNGAAAGAFDVSDAAYSLQRYEIQDATGSPVWMYDKALFDQQDHKYWNINTAMDLAHLIGDAIVPDQNAKTLTINVGVRFPDNAFKQILCNTYGAIGSRAFSISKGAWNGNLYDTTKYNSAGGNYPDWWKDWNDLPNGDPLNAVDPSMYCGTGPYHVSVVDTSNEFEGRVLLGRNSGFWQGWPQRAIPGWSSSLETVEIDYFTEFLPRAFTFNMGGLDSIEILRGDFPIFLDPTTKEPSVKGEKTIANIAPGLSMDSMMFNFVISSSSPYVGTKSFPNGIPLNFFNNTHVRKAFAYAFDPTTYGQQVYGGEYCYRKNWLAEGLFPDYYNDTVPGYGANYAAAENELKQAFVNGQNVWNSGFSFNLVYDQTDDCKGEACLMISDFFNVLSTYDGRTGPPFTVTVLEADPNVWTYEYIVGNLPMYPVSCPANFADADDFARPYMYSAGSFAYYQGYTATNGWGTLKDRLIDQAVLTPDGSSRQTLYNNLTQIYYNDCPSFPLTNPHVRRWCWYWVKGWYYNALYPGTYYYSIWKQDTCWFDVTGTINGISDGITNMRDLAYLSNVHFNARAPMPGIPPDPKWVGIYGANGCVDPYGDRVCNMKDISGCILHFNHKNNTLCDLS